MDKKLKGDIAETSVIAKCVKLGYKVCIPVGTQREIKGNPEQYKNNWKLLE